MATLNRVTCQAGQWTVISGGMSSGMNYRIQCLTSPFNISESTADPTESESRFTYNQRDFEDLRFDGTPFRVYPINGPAIIEIQTVG